MTTNDFTYVRTQLDILKKEIEQGAYIGYPGDSPTDGWSGAGIGFSTVPIDLGEPGFYPDPIIVVTPHAHAAGWLMDRLCRLFIHDRLVINCSKEEFFGRLANTALKYQQDITGRKDNARNLLESVLRKAPAVLIKKYGRSCACV